MAHATQATDVTITNYTIIESSLVNKIDDKIIWFTPKKSTHLQQDVRCE